MADKLNAASLAMTAFDMGVEAAKPLIEDAYERGTVETLRKVSKAYNMGGTMLPLPVKLDDICDAIGREGFEAVDQWLRSQGRK